LVEVSCAQGKLPNLSGRAVFLLTNNMKIFFNTVLDRPQATKLEEIINRNGLEHLINVKFFNDGGFLNAKE
jgi:hypothetical protein